MLNVERCRELLGNDDLTDDQVTHIRDTLRDMADFLIEKHLEENKNERPARTPDPTANRYEL